MDGGVASAQLVHSHHAVDRQLSVRLTDKEEEGGLVSGGFSKVDNFDGRHAASGQQGVVLVRVVVRD